MTRFFISRVSDWQFKEPPTAGASLHAEKPERTWVIDIDSLEDLLALADREGVALIVDPEDGLEFRSLTVYDDYIE